MAIWTPYGRVRAHRSHRWGRWFESNCHHHPEKLEKSGFSFFLPAPRGTHLSYTKFGVGKVTVHLISQTFDVNEIADRCNQGAGNKRSAPSQAPSDDITGHAKKQKSGAARSASRLTAHAVCRMNCSQPAPFTSRYPQMLPS